MLQRWTITYTLMYLFYVQERFSVSRVSYAASIVGKYTFHAKKTKRNGKKMKFSLQLHTIRTRTKERKTPTISHHLNIVILYEAKINEKYLKPEINDEMCP